MDFDALKNKAQDAISNVTGDPDAAPDRRGELDHAEEPGAVDQTDYQNQPNGLDQTDYQNQPDGLDQRGHQDEGL